MKKLWKALSKSSLLHGFYVTAGTSAATAVLPMLESGSLPTGDQAKGIVVSGLIAGVIYIIKNAVAGSSEKK